MDLIVAYNQSSSGNSSEDENSPEHKKNENFRAPLKLAAETVNSAPHVYELDHNPNATFWAQNLGNTKVLSCNPTFEAMNTPEEGPLNHSSVRKPPTLPKNTHTGYIEPTAMQPYHFEEQRLTFITYGYAADPSVGAAGKIDGASRFLGDEDKAKSMACCTVFEKAPRGMSEKRKREARGDASDLEGFKGPWAKYEDELVVMKPSAEEVEILEKQAKLRKANREKKANADGGQEQDDDFDSMEETSILHISDFYDYQGRTYLHIPTETEDGVDLRNELPPKKCFLPKKLIHTWSGHSRGVSTFKLFPGSGHLLLSAGMDSTVKLWEVYGKRRCLRTFLGHTKAVKDVDFNFDGSRFISASYDRWIKLWEVDTGKCIGKFRSPSVPYCVKFYPTFQNGNFFVVGCADKKVYTWDSNTGEIVQEYDRHLNAVNTITFFDKCHKFATTSDDKSIRVWEWDIPVEANIIAEPTMHAISAASISQNEKWFAGQSSENKILIFSCKEKFKLARKKVFKGHLVAGYGCIPAFSPDGSYIISGDSEGKLCIWDFKNTKMYSKFKAHDQVVICSAWLPHETSKVITCSWDGTLKLWD